MAEFEVPVVRVTKVEDHPNADRLSLIWIKGFAVVTAKNEDGTHRYKEGDLVIYAPEGSVIPENRLRVGFWDAEKGHGTLSGKDHNVVKAIKLRGVVSQGILFHVGFIDGKWFINAPEYGTEVHEGDNMAEVLGITKYAPPIPVAMQGEVFCYGNLVHFDVENVKKYPNVLVEGEEVIITEKLHGTMFGIVIDNSGVHCFSKGLGAKGLVFENNETNLANNLYVRTLAPYMKLMRDAYEQDTFPRATGEQFFIFGEIYGKDVQDLHYSTDNPKVCVFDMAYTANGLAPGWIDWDIIEMAYKNFGLEVVPILYRGPYTATVHKLKDEPSVFGGIREGIVIKPTKPRGFENGRVIFKDISDKYLLRRGGTELQ